MDTVKRKSSGGLGRSTIPESDLSQFCLIFLSLISGDYAIVQILDDCTNVLKIKSELKKFSNQKTFKDVCFLLLAFLTEKSTVAATL